MCNSNQGRHTAAIGWSSVRSYEAVDWAVDEIVAEEYSMEVCWRVAAACVLHKFGFLWLSTAVISRVLCGYHFS